MQCSKFTMTRSTSSPKKYRFGNVMNKNWLENISNSELYIAS